MKITIVVLSVALALLSAAAGAAKVTLVAEEVAFLSGFGFSEVAIIVYGVIQIAGGLLMVVPISRVFGAVVVLVSFATSTGLLILDGDWAFAFVSLLPVVLSGVLVFQLRRRSSKPKEADAYFAQKKYIYIHFIFL